MKKTVIFLTILTLYVHAVDMEERRKSCEAGDPKSCKVMGDLTRAGLGVEEDYTKAYYYYDKSCFDGNKDACNELEAMDKK